MNRKALSTDNQGNRQKNDDTRGIGWPSTVTLVPGPPMSSW